MYCFSYDAGNSLHASLSPQNDLLASSFPLIIKDLAQSENEEFPFKSESHIKQFKIKSEVWVATWLTLLSCWFFPLQNHVILPYEPRTIWQFVRYSVIIFHEVFVFVKVTSHGYEISRERTRVNIKFPARERDSFISNKELHIIFRPRSKSS